jgi:hypothetical protein
MLPCGIHLHTTRAYLLIRAALPMKMRAAANNGIVGSLFATRLYYHCDLRPRMAQLLVRKHLGAGCKKMQRKRNLKRRRKTRLGFAWWAPKASAIALLLGLSCTYTYAYLQMANTNSIKNITK